MSQELFPHYESTKDEELYIFQVYDFYEATSDFTFFKLKEEIKKNSGGKTQKQLLNLLKKYTKREIAVGWHSGEIVYIELKKG
jgi:hypothetical protein